VRIGVKGEEWLDDLFAASEALSQLSYTSTRGKSKDDAFDYFGTIQTIQGRSQYMCFHRVTIFFRILDFMGVFLQEEL